MRFFKKLVWVFLAIMVVISAVIVLCFKVDDMTLSNGKLTAFDEGWTVTLEGDAPQQVTLPFTAPCEAERTVVAENDIPPEYWGQTLSFLSADKTLRVSVDGTVIYEFGIDDVRLFGHTPGSVTNFIDIPADLTQGHIVIEMVSPYADYAARISNMTLARRDTSILAMLQRNLFNIVCCALILFSGMVFGILAIMRLVSHQSTGGLQYLSVLSFVAFIYYSIETKALSLLYGNQTLYSALIFLILMILPMLLLLYYQHGLVGVYHWLCIGLLTLVSCNIVFQLFMQLTNRCDFMDMASLSHGLIFLTSLVVLSVFVRLAITERNRNAMFEFFALAAMISGSTIDLVRTYVVKVGDLGKYSRYGMTIFCIIMLIEHIRAIARSYAKSLEENAALLQRELERQTDVATERGEKIDRLSDQIVMALVTAIDAKDRYTNGHSLRVAQYSREIARRMGMSEAEQQDLYYIALLHDIGKIGIPDEIINKPSRLTEEEYAIIKSHPTIGAGILKNISEMPGIEIGAGGHHEHYDGSGYPAGLAGNEIPLVARIIGVADAYDAMTSRRSYRDVMPQNVVRKEIERGRGHQFDPVVADCMLDMMDSDIHYDMREK